MYNPSLTTRSNNTSGFIATTFDDFAKKKKAKGENRKSYYGNLVRPDGSPLSEKDCLLLDLCIQWTKEGKICTSTYKWLLKNKFPRQRHNRTVSRTFYNISLYINANFKNSQIINDVVEKDKIKIERVADFDQKMIEAITKSEEQNNQNYSSKCQPSATQMSTMDDTNVNPSTYIYKKTIKITTDNHDYQHNQLLNSKNFSSESIETEEAKIATSEIVENSELPVAREECNVTKEYNTKTVESVETPIASDYVLGSVTETEAYSQEDEYIEANDFTDVPMDVLEPPKPEEEPTEVEFVESVESLKGKQDITSYHRKLKTVETVGKDGNTYQSPYLRDFRFTDCMIQTAISQSNKKHYNTSRVWVIIRNILEKKPDKTVYGGKQGAINYLVKAINGEKDYEYEYKYPSTKEERAISMAEISNMKRIQLEKELVKNEIKWF